MVSPDKYIAGRSTADWIAAYPVVSDLCALKETAWVNPDKLPFAQAAAACPLTLADIEDAAARLERFAPYLAAVFPETAATGGIIESPVRPIPRMQKVLEERSGTPIAGQIWVKLDSHLPISGSIKARGGIYEVLKTAEDIALHSGMLHLTDNYAVLAEEHFRKLFSQYSIAVGSTGNLGLSIGIIMDGNGRWAKNRGLPRTAGHKKGAEVFSDIADYCDELGVSSVYFYAFSTENWKRPLEEVNAIMRLFGEYLLKGFDYKNRNIRIKFMGDRTVLDPKLQALMDRLEADSSVKTGMTLNIAINYGGRPEIVRAAQRLAARAAAGEIRPEEITEQMLSDAMYTEGQKDPDFILRPSGEKRLSNFMLWQAAYSELVEMDVLWPDFTRSDLDAAIEEFNHRSRRFGGL